MKKSLKICFCLFILLLAVISCVACGETATVKLYDGRNVVKEVSVSTDKEYDFGTLQKVGYSFKGWYSAENGGSAFTDANGKSAGMTWKAENGSAAYAQWEPNTYKITFEYEGATSQNDTTDVSVVYDKKISAKFPVPSKAGRSFVGWFTAKTGGTQITDAKGHFVANADVYSDQKYPVSAEGTTLYARWGEKTITFNFVTDGTEVKSVTYQAGETITALPASVKDGYCFEAWYFDPTGLSQLTYPYVVTEKLGGTVHLYAKFTEGSNNVLQFSSIASTGDKEYEVSYTGTDEEIVIPDSYYGKPVTRVRKISSATLRRALLPQSVREFVNGAFENCTALEEVNIPNGVKVLPERLFSGAGKLTGITIPYSVETIGKSAFANCTGIAIMRLPASVRTIGAGAFRNMSSLIAFEVDPENERYLAKEDVLYYKVGTSTYLVQYPAQKTGDVYEIDDSAVKILEYAFSSAQIGTITIGGKISSIEAGAFENCRKLVNVTIGSSAVTFSIGEGAFTDCKNLRAIKIELDKVPTLAENVFVGVSDTFSVYVNSKMLRNYQTATNWRGLADRIYSIGLIFGDYALEEYNGGYAIKQYFGTEREVLIPEIINAKKIVRISDSAFSFSDIEKVTIGKNVTEIGHRAFYDCRNLSSIIMECTPPALGDDVWTGIADDFGIYINNTPQVLDQYRTAPEWSDMSDKIWSYQ